MFTFIAETSEYAGGGLHNGDKPTGESIARHLARVIEALPKTVETCRARADSGFYYWDAVKAYTEWRCDFVIVARKTDRLLGELQAAEWRSSSQTDADFECQFSYQPEGWEREYRFVGLRYDPPEPDATKPGSDWTFRWLGLPLPRVCDQYQEPEMESGRGGGVL